MILSHLKTFVRIIDAGSLTRAAEQLSLTQPAVTKQLAALEESFQTRLVIRQGRRLRLTPSGEVLYHYAKRILALVDQTYEAIAEIERPGQGEIDLGAVSTIAVFSLPKVLAIFTRNFPSLRVRVHIGEIQDTLDKVIRQDVAVGLVTVPIVHPQVDSVPLFQDPVRLVVSPEKAKKLPRELDLEELSHMEFISYQTPSRFRAFMDGVLEQHGIIPHVLMEFNSHDLVKSMVKVGLGVAFVPESVVAEDLANGSLETIRVKNLPPLARTTSLILAKDPPRSGGLMALLTTFFDHYQVEPRLWPPWYWETRAYEAALPWNPHQKESKERKP
ncbi:DNA-binding transcriptional regulator, LysR family [Sulfobacillus thermosulfidooxidans DSM 9293]|uniref:DNA-binding transcriptional regulator, LysR family n=1 Tax=Sulfobacillus thermosulfidooxidans (strain DSM 9293 / VKM B-1269 / AT-1) TaxID=929705 RepID=A0A1W1WE93_SULTA|nr:LysR family transcriptional regulator [Sulfobacillus thermosulfidooxidans]SMC04522.1 DNA-binding transcriptional regulator, LysR family [Sulfobacillus thermosulfidooxidans DSM 9293]